MKTASLCRIDGNPTSPPSLIPPPFNWNGQLTNKMKTVIILIQSRYMPSTLQIHCMLRAEWVDVRYTNWMSYKSSDTIPANLSILLLKIIFQTEIIEKSLFSIEHIVETARFSVYQFVSYVFCVCCFSSTISKRIEEMNINLSSHRLKSNRFRHADRCIPEICQFREM